MTLSSLYLHTIFTFKPFPTVVRHLVPNQVGFPVESLGTLVTLVLPLLGVDHHVLLQAGEERQAESRSGTQRGDRDGDREPAVGPGGFPVTWCLKAGKDPSIVRRAMTPKQHLRFLTFISLVEDALFCLKLMLCFVLFLINTRVCAQG